MGIMDEKEQKGRGVMQISVIDCETVPNTNLPAGTIPQFDPDSVKVGNIKDPEKVKAKVAKERAVFNNSLIKKMSLHPDLCEVCCFAGMRYDTETGTSVTTVLSGEPQTIEQAWSFIADAYHDFVPIVSYNGIGFDLPVLLHRAMDLNVPVSGRIYQDITKRYSITHHYDLMQILAGWDRQKWESLDFYLQRFGIGEKTGDGGDVYKMWKDGKINEIEEYCKSDVELTAKLFARLESWIVPGVSTDD